MSQVEEKDQPKTRRIIKIISKDDVQKREVDQHDIIFFFKQEFLEYKKETDKRFSQLEELFRQYKEEAVRKILALESKDKNLEEQLSRSSKCLSKVDMKTILLEAKHCYLEQLKAENDKKVATLENRTSSTEVNCKCLEANLAKIMGHINPPMTQAPPYSSS